MTDGEKVLRSMIARKGAEQDQEIAAGVDAMRASSLSGVLSFWHNLNDAGDNPAALREFPEDMLILVRNLAMIGFHEVFDRAFVAQP